ncbi:protein FAR1-RELATED SEQUENCE 5-like [Zingiber officinale]|uniref:protein FAR1-RELATED SEQUENCE 5-like n=1 Tax=Zingiber officinale TaxID=94328 RepID=UPI001C4CB552|nr:protein FAR1-RELATED SEQUENCE 5-like [Zingiber officinale]
MKMIQRSPPLSTDELVPKIGMEFQIEEEAYDFYLKYAKQVGFDIRRTRTHNDNSGRLIDRTFCCSAQGKRGKDKRDIYVKQSRAETRFGCDAKLRISCRNNDKFCVVNFIKEHNHYLSSPNKTHLYRCHRNISSSAAIQIEMTSEVGIPPKASHDLMMRQAGGRENLGFIPEDYKNYLQSKRTRNMRVGGTGGVLEYLQKMQCDDPNFFNAIQVDEDDLITNIFWSDAKMRADYDNFGDVVCFDTTYRKNNEGRPIALFVGVYHHKQSIIFGAALLYDETTLSFEWLFDTFTKAMSEKKPTTILTDQDAAMAKALAFRWPETHHRLCIWHIYQNAAIHLSGVFSQFKEFAKDFASCIYDFDEEEDFLSTWNLMLTKYALEDNDWIPNEYILKRWTRNAKDEYFEGNDTIVNKDSLDPKILHNMRYRDLCGLSVQLVTKAAERDDTHMVVKNAMLSLCKMVDEKLQVNESIVHQSNLSQEASQLVQSLDDTTRNLNETEYQIGEGNDLTVKGIKPKKKTVSSKRLKRGIE